MKYQVKVDGKVYEVEVEKVGGAPKSLSMADFAAPAAPTAPAPQAAPAAPKAEPAPQAAPAPAASTGGEQVIAPMPGNILKVLVNDGDQVAAGDIVVILEAMKMENEIVAPTAGTVTMKVKAGETVDTDQLIAEIN
ncbi:biotin/lipoyl-containing protein [Peptoniphilus catoniae]|uniref:biotin/lipoyl-containing protein n=1 Tax=Peptoniphilus catoniae TaxID=1660341 RepID=UPI0010FDD020|nr:biotin/lipoyl-containing protein [Peptoniphilus catoniae]